MLYIVLVFYGDVTVYKYHFDGYSAQIIQCYKISDEDIFISYPKSAKMQSSNPW
jgi:hypothetical protein